MTPAVLSAGLWAANAIVAGLLAIACWKERQR